MNTTKKVEKVSTIAEVFDPRIITNIPEEKVRDACWSMVLDKRNQIEPMKQKVPKRKLKTLGFKTKDSYRMLVDKINDIIKGRATAKIVNDSDSFVLMEFMAA